MVTTRVLAALGSAAVLLVGVVGCGSGGSGSAGTSSNPAGTSSGPAAAASSAAVGADQFVNPIVSSNFPDPAMFHAGDTFYLYGTQGKQGNLQLRTSADLVAWTEQPDPLPQLGGWAAAGKTWAPEVIAAAGTYVMFYTASDTASGKQCIGRARASTPEGPFTDSSAAPIICQPSLGGSIDPNPVAAPDGSLYLYWKNDGNCCGQPVQLWGQAMDAAAATLTGEPVALLTNTQPWQGNLIEAPEMVAHDGSYDLFYAANDYSSEAYAEGYARCTAPLGPYTDTPSPVLATTDSAAGPGHGYPFSVGDKTWVVYHAWPPDAVGSLSPGRQVWLDPVTWGPDGPTVQGPTDTAQARPVVAPG